MNDSKINISKEFSDLLNTAKTMLDRLGLPSDFVFVLVDQDDWGFILKCHCLVDAAIDETLTKVCFGPGISRPRDEEKLLKLQDQCLLMGKAVR
tara:strand:- start:245 stop:526 length:282 start_codon:yes stop_codon:yes gene_type:complete